MFIVQEVSVDGSHIHDTDYNDRDEASGIARGIAENGSDLLVAVAVVDTRTSRTVALFVA